MPESDLKNKTAKGLFWGGIGSGVQQLASVLFGIILARLLTQEDYGMIGVLAVFMGVAQTAVEGGFTVCLINKKEVRHEDYNSVFWFNFGLGLCLYALFFFCAPLIARFYNDQSLIELSRVLFLWFLFGSLGTAHYALLIKKMKVKERAIIDMVSLSISSIIGIIIVLKGYGYWGLAIQTVLHSLIATIFRWHYSSWHPTLSFRFSPLKEMLPVSIMLVLTGFIAQINANILSVFLGRIDNSKHQVGDYYQAYKWSNMGSLFITNIIQGVAQPVLVETEGDLVRQQNVFRKILRFTAFISFPAMLGLAFISEELIVILITEKWLASIAIMQLLCVWGAFFPINNLYIQLLFSHGKTKIYLFVTLLLGLMQILSLACTHSYGILVIVKMFICINFLFLLVWHYFANKLIHIRFIHFLKDTMPFFFISCIIFCVCYFISLPIENIYLKLIVKIVISVSGYILIMWKTDSVIFKEAMQYFIKKEVKP